MNPFVVCIYLRIAVIDLEKYASFIIEPTAFIQEEARNISLTLSAPPIHPF